jgi:hypothetical protein
MHGTWLVVRKRRLRSPHSIAPALRRYLFVWHPAQVRGVPLNFARFA